MNIRSYSCAHDFLLDTETMLEERELDNNLILGICQNLADPKKAEPDHVYIAVYDGREVVACSIKTFSKAISFSKVDTKRATELLAGYYRDNQIPITGVFAETQHAHDFARFYGIGTNGSTSSLGSGSASLLVHELTKVNPLPKAEGSLHNATESDLELIVEWIQRFEDDADIHPRQSVEQITTATNARIARGDFSIWMHEGKKVNMAGVMRRTKNIGIIGLVYTPPEFRGKGYATSCVKEVSESVLRSGLKACGLFTDVANPTSNAIYSRIGYVPSTQFSDIDFAI